MRRIPVNPWQWSLSLAYNQAELLQAPERVLVCAGQAAVDADGRPQHRGDMAAQLALAADNLQAVLVAASMGLADVVDLTLYTTDVDALLTHYGVLAERLGKAGATPPSTLVGVTRLARTELMVEIQATAAQ
jgi:enamine deaminase RidA (YjgF/YER057c/UK114 family)